MVRHGWRPPHPRTERRAGHARGAKGWTLHMQVMRSETRWRHPNEPSSLATNFWSSQGMRALC